VQHVIQERHIGVALDDVRKLEPLHMPTFARRVAHSQSVSPRIACCPYTTSLPRNEKLGRGSAS
jgi:hypothetical protein